MSHDQAASLPMAAVARAAGLRYVNDNRPGIRRVADGAGVRYLAPDGQPLQDPEQLERIEALHIPPAWTDVWIAPQANAHLQATGRDARGRKQYHYHPRWRVTRDETKFHRMVAFGEALPAIRERVKRDLARHELPREKVLATIVRLLDLTHIRIGNEEYAQENHTYGLTTLQSEHVTVSNTAIHLEFLGKAHKPFRIDVRDRTLARIIKRCQELPGQDLFSYLEDGESHPIRSDDVNDYLQEITGQDFTAKDFRTWAGTVVAVCALRECGAAESETEARKNVVAAIKSTAEHLGNTPAICRKSYVHPAVISAYHDGSLFSAGVEEGESAPSVMALRREEAQVLDFLRSVEEAEHSGKGAA